MAARSRRLAALSRLHWVNVFLYDSAAPAVRQESGRARAALEGPLPKPASTAQRQTVSAPSITAVAARAGVSIATVSRIINGVPKKASKATVARVQSAVSELGYRPMSAGRVLRQGRSRLIAVLAANLANPAMAAIAASTEIALRKQGLVMVLADTHEDPALQDEYIREMRAQMVRATVLLAAVPSAGLTAAQAAGEPLLFVNRRAPRNAAAFVGIDNVRAAEDVAAFLLGSGRRAPAMIHGPLDSSATADRVRAFESCLRRRRVGLPARRIATAPGRDHMTIGYAAMDRLLRGREEIDSLFCLSDLIAFGARRRATEARIDVPGDLMIVGVDDSPLNDWIAPWLSSVRVPYEAFGSAIADALEAMWDGGAGGHRILPHTLVRRP